jgi:hypothetical protein
LRDPDEPIPPTEELYRSLAFGESDGEALLPTSVELPAMSVVRSKYVNGPQEALKADDTGIAVTTPEKLPSPMTSPGGIVHEIRAEDSPSQGDAHAEVRVRRKGTDYNPKYKIDSKPFKADLRRAIAASFKVLTAPRPPDQPSS